MSLGYGVYSVHVCHGLVLLLPLQGEHHLGQGVGDPPPLQNHTWQRVQRAQLLEDILPTSCRPFSGGSILGGVDTRRTAWLHHLGGAELLPQSHSAPAPPGVAQGLLALRCSQVTVGWQVEFEKQHLRGTKIDIFRVIEVMIKLI